MTFAEARAMAVKVDGGCKNGFELDMSTFISRNEKWLTKVYPLEGGRFLRATLLWREHYEKKQNMAGQTFRVHDGLYIPCLHFAEFVKEGMFETSHGLGYWVNYGQPVKRRTVKALQQITGELTDGDILESYEHAKRTQINLYA